MEYKTTNNLQETKIGSDLTTPRKPQAKKQLIQEPKVAKTTIVQPATIKPLRTVPFESGFHFYLTLGNYTGITATNLSEFASKLQTIPAESISFHFQRQDFQKWTKYTLEDNALTERISKIKADQPAEDLRKELLATVGARFALQSRA